MRVVCTIHPNAAFRTFTLDEKITDQYLGGICGDKTDDEKLAAFLKSLEGIKLVNEASIRKYEISISIVDAFENSSEDWIRITQAVMQAIMTYYDKSDDAIQFSVKDDRLKYARSGSNNE